MVQTIKIIIALAVLALLPACWGLKRPSPVTSTIEPCTTNPFQGSCGEDYEIERIVKITECITGDAAATPTCAGAVAANTCLRDPFAEACATDNSFAAYVDRARNARATYCAVDNANATLCAGVAGSVQFDMACLDSPLDAPAYPTCATRPSVVRICADDPFTQTGCGNVTTIEMLRIAHCEDSATAWDDDCVEATYTGAEAARNTACLTHGIDVDAGGHADCAMRDNVLRACSETSPFALPVCDAVGDIGMKRTTFCLKTSDNGGANPFNARCEQDTHGDVNMARDTACLASLSADTGCEARIMKTCTDTPLAGVSCAELDGHLGFLDAFCAKEDNAMLGGCAMTPAALCSADPFGVAVTVRDATVDCSADDDYDSARQALCATGMEGTGDCDTAVIAPVVCASSGANANPFAGFCTGTNNIGGGTIAGIRQTALSTCFNGASDGDGDICQNTIMARRMLATACVLAVAFEDRCNYTQYATVRASFCTTQSTTWNEQCDGEGISGTTNARNQACINDEQGDADDGHTGGDTPCPERQAVINACPETDPFAATVCDRVVATTINPRRAIYCNMPINAWKANCTKATYGDTHDPIAAQGEACVDYGIDESAGGHASCTTNYDDWTGSTFTPEFPLIAVTAAASTDTLNQFLSGLTKGAVVPTITGFTALTTTDTPVKANASPHLNLADSAHGFGGQADDGVMFFGGQRTDTSYRYYAGIYSSTDVGLPLTDASQTGVWQAWIRTSGKDPVSEKFELTVGFTESSKEGTLTAFFQSTSGENNALYYNIDGRFGVNGVITGNIAIGANHDGSILESGEEYTLGRLTGLIGAQGVVAAFVSNTNTITEDAGTGNGINPFVGGFVAVPTVAYADWNVATTPDIVLEDSPIANQFLQDIATNGGGGETSVTLDSAQHTGASLGGEAADGFAYKTAGTSPDFVYYVGILPTTNLGLPLNNTTQAGAWNGSFVSIEDGTVATTEFTLTVTFGGATGSNVGSVAPSAAIGNYTFRGDFDANGVIQNGTITHTVTSPAEVISMGTLQGLIGQDGAVGVFISNSDASMDFGGGFVARKP